MNEIFPLVREKKKLNFQLQGGFFFYSLEPANERIPTPTQ